MLITDTVTERRHWHHPRAGYASAFLAFPAWHKWGSHLIPFSWSSDVINLIEFADFLVSKNNQFNKPKYFWYLFSQTFRRAWLFEVTRWILNVSLKVSMKRKIRFSYFFKKIETCHVNNHSPRNEINVVRPFRNIEVESCPFVVYITLQNRKRMGSNIHGADDVCKSMKSIVHEIKVAYLHTSSGSLAERTNFES